MSYKVVQQCFYDFLFNLRGKRVTYIMPCIVLTLFKTPTFISLELHILTNKVYISFTKKGKRSHCGKSANLIQLQAAGMHGLEIMTCLTLNNVS